MSEPLKPLPCPYCGSMPTFEDDKWQLVYCENVKCYASNSMGGDLESWNRRATDQPPLEIRNFKLLCGSDTDEYSAPIDIKPRGEEP